MKYEIIGLSIAAFLAILIVLIKNLVENYIDAIKFEKELQRMHELHLQERKEMHTKMKIFGAVIIAKTVEKILLKRSSD